MLVSSSSGSESELGLNERKCIHSDSDSEDNEALGRLRAIYVVFVFSSFPSIYSLEKVGH